MPRAGSKRRLTPLSPDGDPPPLNWITFDASDPLGLIPPSARKTKALRPVWNYFHLMRHRKGLSKDRCLICNGRFHDGQMHVRSYHARRDKPDARLWRGYGKHLSCFARWSKDGLELK